jgi:hypothetical protein
MAFTASTIFEADIGAGASTNGGGFDPANANMATDLAATLGTGSSPVVTSASYTFVSTDVNHHVFIKSGTNWTPGWYPIVSVSAGAATLNAAIGAVRLVEPAATTYNSVAGCATTASPTSGTWTIDYSQGAAPYSYTDMVIGGTTTQFTSVAHPVGKNLVGNVISVNSGTNFTVQRVLVTSTSGTTATCDKSLGTAAASGGGATLGGALSHSAIFWGMTLVAGMQLFVKYSATPYLFGSSNNVDGGKISFSTGIGVLIMQGYDTTRTIGNTDSNRPIFRANANSITMCSITNNPGLQVLNFVFDNPAAHTAVGGFHASSGWTRLSRCKFDGMTDWAADNTATCSYFEDLEVVNGVSSSNPHLILTAGSIARRCIVRACTGTAAAMSGQASWEDCIVYNVGGVGIALGSNGASAKRCLVHTTVSHGITAASLTDVEDCIVWGAGTAGTIYGVSLTATSQSARLIRSRLGNNRTADYINLFRAELVTGYLHLTVDPCTNAAGGDFSLNNTTGGGADCRGLALTFPGGTTISYPDIGAIQHADPVVVNSTYFSF